MYGEMFLSRRDLYSHEGNKDGLSQYVSLGSGHHFLWMIEEKAFSVEERDGTTCGKFP